MSMDFEGSSGSLREYKGGLKHFDGFEEFFVV